VAESAVRSLALLPRLSEDEERSARLNFLAFGMHEMDCLAGVVGKWILRSRRLQLLGLRSRQTSICPRADDAG
jgi:hypothetical protein